VTFTGGSGDDDVSSSGFDDEISTGAGDDAVEIIASVAAAYDGLSVDAGACDDTVTVAAGELNADITIDGGAGDNTIAVEADDLDLLRTAIVTDANVTNFSIAAITAALAADFTFSALATGIDTVDLTVAAGAAGVDLTLSNFNGGTIQFGLDQTGGVIVSDVGATDSITLVMDEGAAATHTDVDLTDIETVLIVTDSAADDVTFTALDLTGATSLTISGAGNVDIDAAGVADTALETVDLSDMTGVLELDLDTDGVTIIVGDLGDGSTITLAAGDRNTIEFGAEISNEIEISGFDAGSTLSDDVIDLSALGIDFADLDISDDNADTTITSDAFDGSIVLVGVADWTTLAEAQFVM